MIAEALLTGRIESDNASVDAGSDALDAFARQYPEAIDALCGVLSAGCGFEFARFRTEHYSILLRLKPSSALLDVVRHFGGQRSVEALLAGYGFDLDLRAA